MQKNEQKTHSQRVLNDIDRWRMVALVAHVLNMRRISGLGVVLMVGRGRRKRGLLDVYAVGLIVNRRHHGDGGAQGNGGRKDEWPGRKDRIGRGGGAVCLFECGAVYICQWAAGAQPGESGRNAVSACNAPSSCPAAITALGFRDALSLASSLFSSRHAPCASVWSWQMTAARHGTPQASSGGYSRLGHLEGFRESPSVRRAFSTRSKSPIGSSMLF